MRILHISDLHYDGNSRGVEMMLAKMTMLLTDNHKSVDFILFTGDLVFSGSEKKHFAKAKAKLFDYLSEGLKVSPENILFCPGNHDIDRGSIHRGVKPYIQQSVNSVEELDDFYAKKNEVFKDSLGSLKNYKEFAQSYLSHSFSDDVFKDLYSVHYRTYQGNTLAFVSLYTPWLSAIWDEKGDLDDGSLYFPVSALDEILSNVEKRASRRILMMHHPISALKKNLAFEIEDRIYNNFEMLFTGHMHRVMSVVRHTGENGLFEHTAKATLTKGYPIGCTIIENPDQEPNKYLVTEITYVKDSNEWHMGTEPLVVVIPVGQDKEEQIRLREKVHDHIEPEIQNANNLLLQNDGVDSDAFLKNFNEPYIKTQKEDTANSSIAPTVAMTEFFEAETNFIIYGRDKCGKSSLLRRIQLEYLMHYTTYQRIPLYLDAKIESTKVDDKYDVELIFRNYIGLNKRLASSIIQTDKFVLLIDNYRPDDAFGNYLMKVFIANHPDCVLFMATDDNLSNSLKVDSVEFIKNGNFKRVYFHNIRRQELIKYTEANLSDKENKIAVQDKIMMLCRQMELPFNYWTISLFLLIHHKSTDAYGKNLFAILDYCVDEIFDKKKFLVPEAQITFPQIKMVTASLSAYLFEFHEDTVYSATEQDILNFLESEFKKNVRIYAQPKMVFDFLNGCGMLKGQSNGRFSFRLNGFFEYFLAFHMTKSREFKERILSDEVKYLGFRNQLEIYSGFKNDDAETLKFVFERTNTKCRALFQKYGSDKDGTLKEVVKIPEKVEDELRQMSIQKTLTPVEKAQLEDVVEGAVELRSDVHPMYRFDPNSRRIEVVERYLSILARVFKNIDNVDDKIIDTRRVFKAIIDYYCDFGFYLVDNIADEAKEILQNENTAFFDESEEMKLLKMLTNTSPILSQTSLYEGIGHYSLVRLISMEIEELRQDAASNQYRLFVLYFTLFDIALTDYYHKIDQAIEDISKIPLLRYMMFIKLNYYLAFKSSGNSQMASFLQERSKKIKILLDSKTDIDRLQQTLSETRKTSVIMKS